MPSLQRNTQGNKHASTTAILHTKTQFRSLDDANTFTVKVTKRSEPERSICGRELGNYNSFEGVLYCRPHFDQLFKRTGSLDKSFEGTPKIVKPEKPIDNEKPLASKVSSKFGGTREKCVGCKNTVYPTERVTVNGTAYHKSCFKCSHGGCVISPSNYIAHEGRLYCKHHHTQLIREKGNLSQLEGDHDKEPVNENLKVQEVADET
ncbi:hypothetical protein CsSME_00035800 [Camellia sinensis var. sinensis]